MGKKWIRLNGPVWTEADQEHFIKTEKEGLARLLKNPTTLWDPRDWSFARAEELLICIDNLRGELIAWAEGR
jgi:hypothetical protein